MGIAHPTLRVLYVTASSGSNQIVALSYTAAGVLSTLGTAQTTGSGGDTGPGTYGCAVDPTGTFVYAVSYNDPAVNIFPIDGTGAFIADAGTSVVGYTGSRSVFVDPSGRYLYVGGDNSFLTGFAITPGTGALTQLTPNTTSPSFGYADPVTVVP
jgi:6-phosphogluconolactonase (cycloisomerase 2 family)